MLLEGRLDAYNGLQLKEVKAFRNLQPHLLPLLIKDNSFSIYSLGLNFSKLICLLHNSHSVNKIVAKGYVEVVF
jgi:hypothetical protein